MSTVVDSNGNPIVAGEAPVEAQEEEVKVEDIECAYTVGLKKNGEYLFEVFGENAGMVQLMGLHDYAHTRLRVAQDQAAGYGFPLVIKQLNQIGQMLQVMLNMQTQQSKGDLLKK